MPTSTPLIPGYLYQRDVPEAGVCIFVAPMIFNDRIMIGKIGDTMNVLDAWCYDKGLAVPAAEAWDPATQPEPDGWKKHPFTGRYREGGDPAKETRNE